MGVQMCFFEDLEQNGIRIISGSIDSKCWCYGVFATGETFYFTGDARSASMNVLIRDFERTPFLTYDWRSSYEGHNVTQSKWPSSEQCMTHFKNLFTQFLRSNKAGRAKPMTEETYEQLRLAELRDMIS
jgi:hypothetical protein